MPRIAAAGVTVMELEGDSHRDTLKRWGAAKAHLISLKPQIIHGWMYNGNTAALLLRLRSKSRARLLWNVRASLVGVERFPLRVRASIRVNAMLSGAAEVIVYNSHSGQLQHQSAGFRPKASIVIENGVNPSQLQLDPQARDRIRRELALSPSTVVLCNVARLDPMKDHDTLLEATAMLRGLDIKLMLIGPGVTRDCESLRTKIDRLGLQETVVLLGHRDDVGKFLSAADVFCLSSFTEGMPNAVAEAMACELPCVVTDVGDAGRLVGETGIIVPPRNPPALASALRAMIEAPVAQRRQLGREARERIRAGFSLDRMSRSYEELYLRVSNGSTF